MNIEVAAGETIGGLPRHMAMVAFKVETVENGIQLLAAGAQVKQRGDRHVA